MLDGQYLLAANMKPPDVGIVKKKLMMKLSTNTLK